ncbi:MAG TPA: glycosyltransferase [Candidatus Dormibacteraeota bacterium]|nr:glycosyltransferase [Candidatus Dormibacteraeota bacterium]
MDAAQLIDVEVGSAPLDRYQPLLEDGLWFEFERTMGAVAKLLRGRAVWNVNSTARGGGVAELLSSLIPYDRGAGIDSRWVVIQGEPAFFDVTKKLHTLLHGVAVDGSTVTDEERRVYEQTLAGNARRLTELVKPGDVVLLHDPQTAGLAPALVERGCKVIWRCHVGVDEPSDVVRGAWNFLRRYVTAAHALVFSRRRYVWEGLEPSRVHIIPPSIDAFTTKNRELDDKTVTGLLVAGGILQGSNGETDFVRSDGSLAGISHRTEGLPEGGLPPDAKIVLQVSRWDRLKDPIGVMNGFVEHVAPDTDAHLVLAGPATTSVSDDPEQPEIMRELSARHGALPGQIRERVHMAQLPMEDEEENAALVNALQRHADVVVQKSLAEGFGLTVAEAMWKGRPLVASRVGGIEDQVENGRSGLLIDDPRDLDAFGRAVVGLLRDERQARSLGSAARLRIGRHFLAPRHLMQQAGLIRELFEKRS